MKNVIHLTFLVLSMSSLFLTTANSQTFEILSPPACAGVYEVGLPGFGPDYSAAGGSSDVCGKPASTLPTIESGVIVALTSSEQNTSYICAEQLPITNDVSGSIAMVDRGDCEFQEKAQNCQNAGAVMVIICNRDDEVIPLGGDNPNLVIPTIMLKLSDCTKLKAQLSAGTNIVARYTQSVGDAPGPEQAELMTNPTEPSTFLWKEDFAEGLSNWETIPISTELEGQPLDEVIWEYEPTWETQYLADSRPGILTLGAVCNGAVVFDPWSSITDYNGDGNQFLVSELISPTIDLSGTELLQLSFAQMQMIFDGFLFVSLSNDNGATWSEPILVPTENPQNDFDSANTEFVSIPLFDFVGTSESKIKFIADMAAYYIYLDDIIISELQGTNATIAETSYWPSYYSFPLEHACADPFTFSMSVSNTGAEAISSLRMDVIVTNETTGEVEYTGGADYFLIGLGETVIIEDQANWVPTSTGLYSIQHSISVPNQTENTLDDNIAEVQFFEVTEEKFTTHGSQSRKVFDSSFQWEEYGVGATYFMCSEVDEVLAYGIQVDIDSETAVTTLEGNYLTIDIIRYVDGFESFLNFDISNIDLFGNPQLEIVHETIYEFTADDELGIINIPFLPDGELFSLIPGELYMFYIHFDNFQFGNAEVPNSGLGVAFYNDPTRTNNHILRAIPLGQWGQFSNIANPYISLCLNGPGVIDTAMPVNLSDFRAQGSSHSVLLDWTTLSEINHLGFDVERSIDGKSFEKRSFVASDTPNSSREKKYTYIDRDVVSDVTYYYRLKQMDIDGRFEYSHIVNASIQSSSPSVVLSYANPVHKDQSLSLYVNADYSTQVEYFIYDQAGKLHLSNQVEIEKGSSSIQIDHKHFTPGLYYLQYTYGDHSATNKIVIVD